ncbi:hypothetical protein Tsubulata_007440 [Turnera subulata]|uniref:Uncharacterized protein n=1 Tax=Turnera subulata TaxID=218843 RepID=A0A9Q0J0Y5_9ROSI|nr:hypothetical protein Tsubulata_007440 [Turnera subulata]
MCRLLSFNLFLFLIFSQSLGLILAFAPPPPHKSNNNSNTTQILQDVLKEIAGKEKWDLEGIGISKQEVTRVRFGVSRKPEFRLRFGKTQLLFKSPYVVDSWNKLNKSGNDEFGDFLSKAASFALLDTFRLEGPFDLRVNGFHHLSLLLPMNASHSGLKRVLVGEGITVEVRRARELYLYDTLDMRNISVSAIRKTGFCPFWDSMCRVFHPLHIIGSASLVAYKNKNPDAEIKTHFLSADAVELLPDKCYGGKVCNIRARPVHSLSFRIARLEKFLRNFVDERMPQKALLSSVRANLKASTIVRFQLEVEKYVSNNETRPELWEEWRTRPTLERVWFDVMAKVDGQKLKPLTMKKVRPFIAMDSVSWSTLTSNISFTKLSSILAPPEPLTLDVRW